MINVVVTGANCSVAQDLIPRLEEKYNVIKITRENSNLHDSEFVDHFFNTTHVDYVLNLASNGGKKRQTDIPDFFYNNILVFENLFRNKHKYKLMINFGSGISFDDRNSLDEIREYALNKSIPTGYYALSKYMIRERIREAHTNVVNLRIFSLFGKSEEAQRFTKVNIQRYINKEPIVIYQNRLIDFFYEEDMFRVVDHYISECEKGYEVPSWELNLSYMQKVDLIHMATLINTMSDYRVPIQLDDAENPGKSYTGSGYRLDRLYIPFRGIEEGIRDIYEHLMGKR